MSYGWAVGAFARQLRRSIIVSIWNGMDEADVEIHAAEVDADRAAWHADQMAELDAEREAEEAWVARREAEASGAEGFGDPLGDPWHPLWDEILVSL